MRINAVTKIPAQPPPTNATSNHQAEVIWLSPIHAASPAASGYSLLRKCDRRLRSSARGMRLWRDSLRAGWRSPCVGSGISRPIEPRRNCAAARRIRPIEIDHAVGNVVELPPSEGARYCRAKSSRQASLAAISADQVAPLRARPAVPASPLG